MEFYLYVYLTQTSQLDDSSVRFINELTEELKSSATISEEVKAQLLQRLEFQEDLPNDIAGLLLEVQLLLFNIRQLKVDIDLRLESQKHRLEDQAHQIECQQYQINEVTTKISLLQSQSRALSEQISLATNSCIQQQESLNYLLLLTHTLTVRTFVKDIIESKLIQVVTTGLIDVDNLFDIPLLISNRHKKLSMELVDEWMELTTADQDDISKRYKCLTSNHLTLVNSVKVIKDWGNGTSLEEYNPTKFQLSLDAIMNSDIRDEVKSALKILVSIDIDSFALY